MLLKGKDKVPESDESNLMADPQDFLKDLACECTLSIPKRAPEYAALPRVT